MTAPPDAQARPASRFVGGPRLPWAAAAATPLALAGPAGIAAVVAWDALAFGAAALESRWVAERAPRVVRELDARLLVGVPTRVSIHVHNPSNAMLRCVLRDDLPATWSASPNELTISLPPHARRTLTYDVVPPKRGDHAFGDVHVRVEGPLGLGARIVTTPHAATARVFPDVLGTRDGMNTRLADLRSLGIRHVRKAGGGGEFDQLREYVAGDGFRDVDWKASAKRLRPVTRVLREERSQSILLALDVGRLMAITSDERRSSGGTRIVHTKLDHALRALLLLAWVALQQGDRVGLVVFAEDVRVFIPPQRGAHTYRAILEATYSLEAHAVAVDARRLTEHLKRRLPRRSLVVVFSDLLDDTHALPLAEHLRTLRPKHLPLCVTQHDAVAEALAGGPVNDTESAFQRAAAASLLDDRAAVEAKLRSGGVLLVEAPAEELAAKTVNRYLEIKARNLL